MFWGEGEEQNLYVSEMELQRQVSGFQLCFPYRFRQYGFDKGFLGKQ